MLSPKITKFHKQHSGRMRGISCRGIMTDWEARLKRIGREIL